MTVAKNNMGMENLEYKVLLINRLLDLIDKSFQMFDDFDELFELKFEINEYKYSKKYSTIYTSIRNFNHYIVVDLRDDDCHLADSIEYHIYKDQFNESDLVERYDIIEQNIAKKWCNSLFKEKE